MILTCIRQMSKESALISYKTLKRTLTVDGASIWISRWTRSAIPAYMVVPPERTMLLNSSLRTSRSL